MSEVIYKCQACNKTFKSQSQLNEHKKSKKHKKNEKDFLKKFPDASEDSIFGSIKHSQYVESEKSFEIVKNENVLDDLKNEIQM